MKFFRYYMSGYGEKVIGLIKAKNMFEAEHIFRNTYQDWGNWNVKITEITLNDSITEIYYGG